MAALFNLLDDLPSGMRNTITTTQTITGVLVLPLLTYSPLLPQDLSRYPNVEMY